MVLKGRSRPVTAVKGSRVRHCFRGPPPTFGAVPRSIYTGIKNQNKVKTNVICIRRDTVVGQLDAIFSADGGLFFIVHFRKINSSRHQSALKRQMENKLPMLSSYIPSCWVLVILETLAIKPIIQNHVNIPAGTQARKIRPAEYVT